MEVEDDIAAAGIQIVWVLVQDRSFGGGTAANCRAYMDSKGSTQGLCVGNDEIAPDTNPFGTSADLASGRGFDVLVKRSTMQLVYSTNHGTTSGNANLSAQEYLAEVLAANAQ